MTNLSPVAQRFLLHWGEMGTRWGINRTVAQVHALLYLSPKPLNADQVVEALGVARSNVSNCLKELQGWGIVRLVHVLGDKRDHFESMKDVWEMFRIILDERKKREIDPTIRLLRECVAEAAHMRQRDAYVLQRLEALDEFFTQTGSWYAEVRSWSMPAIMRFLKLAAKARRLLGIEG